MDKIAITGGVPLTGNITIGGAKNAALPLMAANLLTEETLTISNIPYLADITTMAALLAQHGVALTMSGEGTGGSHYGRILSLNAAGVDNFTAPYDLVRTMRASVLVLGPLLARFGQAKVSLPGGCAIGSRPIDMHLKALAQMGADIVLKEGYVETSVSGRLKGADIAFDKVSVGATENLLMAATLAEGTTILRNAAREPEVADLANCLVAMGAQIDGIGSDRVEITGVKELHGADYRVISDRIEAGTYLMAAAITGGKLHLQGIEARLLRSVIEKLHAAGVTIAEEEDAISVESDGASALTAVDITTQPYPGFPTDMQAQIMAMLTLAAGTSTISETIFENRFMHVPELLRMGADITINDRTAIVRGVKSLKGAEVMATDLRASVCLVIAALAARGQSVIHRVYHLDRGYERLEEKLSACGAQIERIS